MTIAEIEVNTNKDTTVVGKILVTNTKFIICVYYIQISDTNG
jgi:hypothetical protein